MKELVQIQTSLKAPKDQWNDFGKYKYRNAEGILEAVKPLLSKTECTLIMADEIVNVADRIYVKATATIKNKDGETESATAFAREPLQKKGQDESQVTGADDNKDADALNTNKEYTQPAQQQDDPLKEAFELVKPNILSAPSHEYLKNLIDQNEALKEYPPFKSAINARWKQVK